MVLREKTVSNLQVPDQNLLVQVGNKGCHPKRKLCKLN